MCSVAVRKLLRACAWKGPFQSSTELISNVGHGCTLSLTLLRAAAEYGLCGSLSVIDLQHLRGSGTLRRCGFVGIGKALLEEVCHCGGGL